MKKSSKINLKQSLNTDLTVEALLAILAQKDQQLAAKSERIELLEEQLRLATLRKFAASSEKSAYQISLFDEAELEGSLDDLNQQVEALEEQPKKKSQSTRKRGFAENLPRKQVHISLTDAEKQGAERTFFSKVKEELDIIPAQVQILEYWQEKAVFAEAYGEQEVVAAERTPHPLGKCQASVGLLAHIVASKYADGLPLYRLESILSRYGGDVNRSTMANWIIRLEDVFRPLLNLGHESLLAHGYLQADETRLQVLKETGKAATSDKWMWVLRGGPPTRPFVLFDYDASRSEQVPLRLLDGYQGVLQVDGYAGYNKVCTKQGLTRIGCWDHVRRKFVEASRAAKPSQSHKTKAAKPSKADVAVGMINKLYSLERKFKDMSPEERQQARQSHSLPALHKLKTWLDKEVTRVAKGNLTYKAIYYAINQWPTLTGYCDDGQLQISNVLAENAIRPFAVGRKAWLFSDSPKGAKASAACFSLIESAKANGIEPYAYLQHVLTHIAAADSVEKLDALLPWNTPMVQGQTT
jgi:transposase